MKIDLSRLPLGEALIGFLLLALVVTFVLAFDEVSGGGDEGDGGNGNVEPTATPGDGGTPVPGDVEVVIDDNFFDPEEVTVAAGQAVTIAIANEGAGIHNLHIAGEGREYADDSCEPGGADPCSDPKAIRGGQTGVMEWVVPDTPGEEVPFRCDFHPVEMTGTITIQ